MTQLLDNSMGITSTLRSGASPEHPAGHAAGHPAGHPLTAPQLAPLSLKIFYPDAIAEDEIDEYNRAFAFWYEVWIETRRELDRTLGAPSDSFSRQSEILVLYCDGKPIATCCHRYVDLRHHTTFYDSYFTAEIWPASVKASIPGLGNTCMLGSHIYLHRDFRKSRSDLPIKHIICALSMAHINGTRPDVLLGATRVDRGIDKLFHDAGAVSLHSHISWYHIPLDLIALFPKKAAIVVDPRYHEAVRTVGNTCDRFGKDYFARARHHHAAETAGRGGELNGSRDPAFVTSMAR